MAVAVHCILASARPLAGSSLLLRARLGRRRRGHEKRLVRTLSDTDADPNRARSRVRMPRSRKDRSDEMEAINRKRGRSSGGTSIRARRSCGQCQQCRAHYSGAVAATMGPIADTGRQPDSWARQGSRRN